MNRSFFGCFLSAVLVSAWSLPSDATVVSIDQFTITKNGSTFFTDTFSNNLTPTQEGGTYNVGGVFPNGAESGGLLTLDSDWGLSTANAAGQARQSLTVTRTSPNSSSGLTVNDALNVTGIFNLMIPSGSLTNGYGVRVIESGLQNVARLVELDVQYNAAFGGDVIRFLLQDFVGDSITTLGFVALTPPNGADQVELSISRDIGGGFFGAYAFGTGGSFGSLTTFSTPGTLFTSTDFVRGQFIAFTAVPEPGTLALVGLGLAGLAACRRRKR